MMQNLKFLVLAVSILFFAACSNGNAPSAKTPSLSPELPQSTTTPTSQPTATPTQTPTSTPTPTPTPMGGSSTVLLGFLNCRGFPCFTWDGGTTIRVDLETGETDLLGEGKYILEDISPDGKSLLVSESTNLYVTDLDGNNPILIASYFLDTIEIAAFWMSSGEITYIGFEGQQRYICYS